MTDKSKTTVHADIFVVKNALRNERKAEDLLRRLYPKIHQVVRYVMGNHQYVDDVGQIAAVEIMRSLDRYKGKGSLESWAGRIAYRVALRKVGAETDLLKNAAPLCEDHMIEGVTPDQTIHRYQLFKALLDKMERIPHKRRIPLLLHIGEGYTVSELSELIEVSQNTMKARLKTAYRELRQILEKNPELYKAIREELR